MSNVMEALGRRMDYLVARQQVIASNIANADTPNYLAKDLTPPPANSSFGMMVANARHMANGSQAAASGRVVEDATFVQHNGNSVRLDMEMMKMNEVQGNYRMMTQLYTKQATLQAIALGKK